MDEFFKNHVTDNTQLRSVDETGRIHPLEGFEYDPEKTYVWEENGKRMEYQGISEVTPGFVTCPLCNGWGEVEKAIADWYGQKQSDQIVEEDQEEERPTWG